MPKFSANLTMLYNEVPFLERFQQAAEDGFTAVEYVSPYEFPASEVAKTLKDNGLKQALFNLPVGDFDAGERGMACHPDRVDEFQTSVATAIEYATALECPKVNCLAGIAPPGVAHDDLEGMLVSNLKYAAPRFADAGVKLLFELINIRDMPGFFVSHTDHAERILERVGSDNLFIQYDFYHTQIMQGDLIPTFERLQDHIGHVQIADTPGRHEPGTGEINYDFVLKALDRLGYDGFVGCEYKPKTATRAGLGWMKNYK